MDYQCLSTAYMDDLIMHQLWQHGRQINVFEREHTNVALYYRKSSQKSLDMTTKKIATCFKILTRKDLELK